VCWRREWPSGYDPTPSSVVVGLNETKGAP